MLPGSRCPRVREPITKSCVPLGDRLHELRYERWNVAAVAIEKHYDVIPPAGPNRATPAAHARP